MASKTRVTMAVRRRKIAKQGLQRKREAARKGTTPVFPIPVETK